MKEMLLAQQQASDQWAYYQGKVIREHLYRSQTLRLEIDLIEQGRGMKPEVKERIEAMLKKMTDEEARYNAEKKEIEKEAKNLNTNGTSIERRILTSNMEKFSFRSPLSWLPSPFCQVLALFFILL